MHMEPIYKVFIKYTYQFVRLKKSIQDLQNGALVTTIALFGLTLSMQKRNYRLSTTIYYLKSSMWKFYII